MIETNPWIMLNFELLCAIFGKTMKAKIRAEVLLAMALIFWAFPSDVNASGTTLIVEKTADVLMKQQDFIRLNASDTSDSTQVQDIFNKISDIAFVNARDGAIDATANRVMAKTLLTIRNLLMKNGGSYNFLSPSFFQKLGNAYKANVALFPSDPVEYILFLSDIAVDVAKDEMTDYYKQAGVPEYKITALLWMIDLGKNNIKFAIFTALGHPIDAARAGLVDNIGLVSEIGLEAGKAYYDLWTILGNYMENARYGMFMDWQMEFMVRVGKAATLYEKTVLYNELKKRFEDEMASASTATDKDQINKMRIQVTEDIKAFDAVDKYNNVRKYFLAGDGGALVNHLNLYFSEADKTYYLNAYQSFNKGTSGGISSGNISISGNGFGTTSGKVVVTIPYTSQNKALFVQNSPYQSTAFYTYNAAISSWTDTAITINIFNDILKWDNFYSPVSIAVYKSDNTTKVAEFTYPFNDVSATDWSQCHIQQLWKKGTVTGKGGSGRFEKTDNISRAEFLVIAMRAVQTGSYLPPSTAPFPDVSTSAWYGPYVAKAKSLGILHGAESDINGVSCVSQGGNPGDKCFFPNAPITRLEAANILAKILGLTADVTINPTWTDYNTAMGLGPWILYSHKGDGNCGSADSVAHGYGNNTFGVQNFITRQEAATIVNRGRTVPGINTLGRGL